MKGKLLSILFFLGFAAVSYAAPGQSIDIELGASVKHGTYYTFPELKVTLTSGMSVKKIYIEHFGSIPDLSSLPSGWTKTSRSDENETYLQNETGSSLDEIQTFLRGVKFSLKSGEKGDHVEMEICDYIEESSGSVVRTAYLGECEDDSGIIGYESTKTAKVNNDAEKKGTLDNPVPVLLGDEITYIIEAVNSSPGDSYSYYSTMTIEDALPEGVELINGSITDGGTFNGGVIKWEFEDLSGGDKKTVSFKVKLATPLQQAYYQNIIKNTAKVTTEWQGVPRSGEVTMRSHYQDEFVYQTDTTYHQRKVCKVKFVIDPAEGGNLTNGDDKIIDYNTMVSGVTVNKNLGYKFIKWKHGDITSLKEGEAATSAAEGGEGDENWYSTIAIKGDVTFTAKMKLLGWKIDYDNNDATPAGMPTAVDPTPENPKAYSPLSTFPIQLKAPTRIGYTFDNWDVTKQADNTQVGTDNKIPSGTEGDLKAKAKWIPKPFNITYELNGGTAPTTANPTDYTIEQLPKNVTNEPTKTNNVFIGWKGVASVGASAQFAPTPAKTVTIPLKKGDVWTQGDLKFEAIWHQRVKNSNKVNCEPPLKLKGVPGAKSYKWERFKSATDKKTVGEALEYDAKESGTYVLLTNYGDTEVADTFNVKFAFEGEVKIENNTKIPAKVNRRQGFAVKMDTVGRTISYAWSVSDGEMTSTSRGDSLYVVFKTPGKKKVSVEVTVTLFGGLICKKDVSTFIDIYEKYHGFFVDQHVTGGREDGSSWENAYKRIEQALDQARAGDCVWVARGTYTPPKGESYIMKYDSVQVYGGFGAWENYLNERLFMSNPTIIQPSENGSSVVTIKGVSSEARWDGFIIEHGDAPQGGGIYNRGSSVTIANCIIRGNRADEGGGMYNESGSPILYNTEISGNTAEKGAGMYNSSSSPRLTNVTISGNLASVNGGGFYNDASNTEVRNTIIWGNRAKQGPNVSNSSSTSTYSFSLIESPRAGWDVSLGTDGGGNVNGNPLFRKKGFDHNGNMQQGNYRLSSQSAALDNGLNRYVYTEKTRDAHLPTLGGSVYHNGFPYDLYGLSRIINDRVDIGAYEFAPDLVFHQVARKIEIPEVEGLIFQPRPGIHYVTTGKDFTFTVSEKKEATTLKASEVKKNLIDRLEIKTGNPIRDKEGVMKVELPDGSVKVTLIKVREPIKLTINGHTTSTQEIAATKVWADKGRVNVLLENASEVRIYTLDGRLAVVQQLNAGETTIPLTEGFYVVRIGNRNYKVIVK